MKHMCRNLTVHGPSFLARRDIAFIYKFVYFIIYVQIWIIAVATIVKYYATYEENTIRFTTHTDYLHWNITFPSITVCEIADTEQITQKKHNEMRIPTNLIKELTFFNGICHSCFSYPQDLSQNQTVNKIMSSYHTECKKLFASCKWNDRYINCCNAFKPVVNEYGTCFTINNKHASGHSLHVATSKENIVDKLTLTLSKNAEGFLHSPEDVPFWNMENDRRITIANGAEATMIFSIIDIVNEPEVSLMSTYERQCRFPEELPPNFQVFQRYSYSACIIQCRIDKQLDLCNCTHYTSPLIYYDRYCDLEGLKCLTKNYPKLMKLKIPGTNETGLNCDCLPSCVESDYNIVSNKVSDTKTMHRGAKIQFKLNNKPFERITRQVARTALDLVVAMGSCFGLCFGGSLLSIVEIVYYVFLRRW